MRRFSPPGSPLGVPLLFSHCPALRLRASHPDSGVFVLRPRGRCDLERLGWPSVPGAAHLLRPLCRQPCLCIRCCAVRRCAAASVCCNSQRRALAACRFWGRRPYRITQRGCCFLLSLPPATSNPRLHGAPPTCHERPCLQEAAPHLQRTPPACKEHPPFARRTPSAPLAMSTPRFQT